MPTDRADRGRPADQRHDVEPDRPWIVIVWNDPINLMCYVVLVLQKLFGYSKEKADVADARRAPQGPGRGVQRAPGEGRARRVPAPRARAVGHHAAGRAERAAPPAGPPHPQRYDPVDLPAEERSCCVSVLPAAPGAARPGARRRPDPPPVPHRLRRRRRGRRRVPGASCATSWWQSRLAALDDRARRPSTPTHSTEPEAVAWMQSINTLRLVLGTVLDVTRRRTSNRCRDDHPDDRRLVPLRLPRLPARGDRRKPSTARSRRAVPAPAS